MRRNLRTIAVLGTLLLCIAGGSTWWAYEATQEVRPFYQQAMAVQPSALRQAGQEFTSRATALVNDVCHDEPWQALFHEDQINGWLAYELPEKHAHLIPQDIADPRVAIEDDRLSIGVRYNGQVTTILSVDVEPYLSEPNVLSLKILGAKAGTLPVPLSEVTERLTLAAARLGIPLSWIQESEAPTALIKLHLRSRETGQRLRLETLALQEGAILVGGVTEVDEPDAEVTSDGDREDTGQKVKERREKRLILSSASPPNS